MAANYMSLDWRQAPSASESISRIERLLTDLDANGGARIRLNESRGQVDPRTRMTMAQARRVLYDLALTIEVHPLALGVIPESNGQVMLPDIVGIDATIVKDIIQYHQGDTAARNFVEKRRFEAGTTSTIPPLVKELKIVEKRKETSRPRAVIVIEHRNLKMVLTEHDFAIKQVILVMTSGYPSGATREFLHMLAKDPVLSDIPFLYISDHDCQGLQIFQVLKYGAVASAFASDILVCPRLIWAGPSKEDLIRSPVAYRDTYEAQHRSDFPHKSTEAVAKAVGNWQKIMATKIDKKLVKATQKDQGIFRSFERLGWLEHEPDLSNEIKVMLEAPSKLRLADMAQVNVRYIRMFTQQKVEDFSPLLTTEAAEAVKVQPPVLRSPLGERYKALSSQVSSIPVGAQSDIDDSEALAMLAEDLP